MLTIKRWPIGRCWAFLLLTLLAGHVAASDSTIEFAPESELILDARLEGRKLGVDLFGYQYGNDYYLSLVEVVDALAFPINVDPNLGKAGGWYIDESREFRLDLDEREVQSGARTFAITAQEATVFEGTLFVRADALQQWLPVNINVEIRQLSVNFRPRERIPLQDRLERLSRRPSDFGFSFREPELPFMENPYQFMGHRTTDARVTYTSTRRDDDVDRQTQYSLLSRGDLAWMTSSLYLSGSDEESLSNARLLLERSHFEGPLALNHVELGDISTGIGRGMLIRGGAVQGALDGQFADEFIDLRGDSLPDWQVELYQNGVLVSVQEVGQDGRYEFLEVPLLLGENVFEFIFYGPFGEERRETKTHYVGPGMLGFGRINYQLSATQSGESVFDENSTIVGGADQGSGFYEASVNVGLTRVLSASFNVESIETNEERRELYSSSLALAFNRFRLQVGYFHDPENLDRYTGNLQLRLGKAQTGIRYTEFTDEGLEPGDIPSNPQRWSGAITLNTAIESVPFNLAISHNESVDDARTQATLANSIRFSRTSRLSTGLTYSREERLVTQPDDPDVLVEEVNDSAVGLLSIYKQLRPWTFQAGLVYQMEPEERLQQLNASARLRIGSDMSMSFEVRREPATRLTTYRYGFNWLLEQLVISPQLSYDTEERWLGIVNISTSIVPRPGQWQPEFTSLSQLHTGTVISNVFIDNNGDGLLGPQDEPLPDVRIRAVQSFAYADTDQRGVAYLDDLVAYRVTDVALDMSTLPEAELIPSHPGRSIKPRPSSWTRLNFPLIRTSEIEGFVRLRDSQGAERPMQRVVVALLDEKGNSVSRQRTAFDGFFVFSAIPPGRYRLELVDVEADRIVKAPGRLDIGGESRLYNDRNFVVRAVQESRRPFSAP